MACKKNQKDEAQIKDTKPAEAVAVTEQDAEQVTGGIKNLEDPPYVEPTL